MYRNPQTNFKTFTLMPMSDRISRQSLNDLQFCSTGLQRYSTFDLVDTKQSSSCISKYGLYTRR